MLEQHYEIGGCCHEFNVNMAGKPIPSALLAKSPQPVFKFEAGPSLYSGLSAERSPNPLKHIYQMIGEEPEWINYDTWGAHLPEVPEGYELSIGAENFMEILRRYGGPTAASDWNKLSEQLMPLTGGVTALPSTAVRGDLGILATLVGKYPVAFWDVIKNKDAILAPFDLEAYGVKDPFLKNYLDLIAFLLQGLPADGTLTAVTARMLIHSSPNPHPLLAQPFTHPLPPLTHPYCPPQVMAFMVDEFYKPDAKMDFPRGGSGEIANALARGVTKHAGCSVRTSTNVDEIVVEQGRAAGVRLKGGRTLRARRAVVSNADLHATFGMVPPGAHAGLDEERSKLLAPAAPIYSDDVGPGTGTGLPLCKSFMHLHLGVKADCMPDDLPPQWTVVNSWDVPIDSPGNVIVVSVRSEE